MVEIYTVCLPIQSCLTLCHPLDCSPPGSSVHEIFQAKMEWSWLPFPPPGDGPNLGIKPESPVSPALQTHSLPAEPSGKLHTLYELLPYKMRT